MAVIVLPLLVSLPSQSQIFSRLPELVSFRNRFASIGHTVLLRPRSEGPVCMPTEALNFNNTTSSLEVRFEIRLSPWRDWITWSGPAHAHPSISEKVMKGLFMENASKQLQIYGSAKRFDANLTWAFATNAIEGLDGFEGNINPILWRVSHL